MEPGKGTLLCENMHPEHCQQCSHCFIRRNHKNCTRLHCRLRLTGCSARAMCKHCIGQAPKGFNRGLPCLGLISSCVSKMRYRYCSQPGVERTTLVMATPGSVAHVNTLASAASRRRNSAVERICRKSVSSKSYRLQRCRVTTLHGAPLCNIVLCPTTHGGGWKPKNGYHASLAEGDRHELAHLAEFALTVCSDTAPCSWPSQLGICNIQHTCICHC